MGNNQAKVKEIFEESDISEERVKEMFEKIDVSEDGHVTFEELCNFIKWMRAGSQTLKNITAEEFKILEDFKNEHVKNNPEDHGMPVEEFVEFMKENEVVKNIVLKLADTK